jgi:hypothetical protein
MHLNAQLMLSKFAATMPLGIGGVPVYTVLRPASRVPQSRVYCFDNNQLIHSFINLTHSL